MKVFVVLYHSEWESYTPSSDVIGVFCKHEDAVECMKAEIENAIRNSWTTPEESTDRNETEDMISLFDNEGCIDYVEVKILEKELE